MKKPTSIALVGVLIASISALTFVQAAGADDAVVQVNGEKITEDEVVAQTERHLQMQAAQMPQGREITDDMRNQIRLGVVDMLVEQELIDQILEEKDIEVEDQRVMQEIQTMAAQQNLTMEQVEQQIAQAGVTMDDLKKDVRTKLEVDQLIDEEMGDGQVDEQTARAFYDENPQYFEQPEQVRVAHVLILTQGKDEQEQAAAREQIEQVLQKAKAGEDFGDLARQYSEDPGSREQGGEYTFPRGQMVPEFEEAAFGMEPGQISDIVETMYGYHVIKKLEHIEPTKQPFDDVKSVIQQHLAQQQRGQFWQQYLAQVEQEADIEYSESEQQLRQAVQEQMQRQQQMMQQMQQMQQQQQR